MSVFFRGCTDDKAVVARDPYLGKMALSGCLVKDKASPFTSFRIGLGGQAPKDRELRHGFLAFIADFDPRPAHLRIQIIRSRFIADVVHHELKRNRNFV